MKKIYTTIIKNYKLIFKSKYAFFILLMAPIVLTYIIGFFYFNASSFAINIGIYSPDNSQFNNFFKSEIKNSEFNIFEYNSITECDSALKSSILHACISLPKNFKISDSSKNTITLTLDTSKGEIMKISQNLINDKISSISKEIQINNIQKLLDIINQSQILLNQTNNNNNNISQINDKLKNYNLKIKLEFLKINSVYNSDSLGVEKLILTSNSLNSSLNTLTNSALFYTNLTDIAQKNINNEINLINDSSSSIDNLEDYTKEIRTNILELERNLLILQNPYFFKKLTKQISELNEKIYLAENSTGDIGSSIDDQIKNMNNNILEINTIINEIEQNNNIYIQKINNLESINARTLISPASIKTIFLTPSTNSHLVSLFPGLIVGLIFLISLVISSMFVLTERKSKANFRNLMSKNTALNYLVGDFLSLFSIVLIQSSLIVILYYFWFLKNISIDFLFLILLLIPIIAIFTLIGMIVGFLSSSESTNVILTFLLIILFFTFSGKLIPLEALSSSVISIASLNPLLLGESLIRKYLLFNLPIIELKTELLLFTIYFIILLIINFILESFSKKRFLHGLFQQLKIHIKNYSYNRKKE